MEYDEGQSLASLFSLRLPQKTRQELQKIAEREKVTIAFVVRKAVRELIERENQTRKDFYASSKTDT